MFEADAGQLRPTQASDEPDQDQGPVPGRGQRALHGIDHPLDERDRLPGLLYPPGRADAGVHLRELAIGFPGAGGRQLVFLVPVRDGRQLRLTVESAAKGRVLRCSP